MQRNCFQNQRLYLEETPSASSKLLFTNTLRSGFLWKTQQHCLLFPEAVGKGPEESLQLRCLEKMLSSYAILSRFCPRLQRSSTSSLLALEFQSPFSLRQSFGGKSSLARISSQGVGSNLLVFSVLFDSLEKLVTMVNIVWQTMNKTWYWPWHLGVCYYSHFKSFCLLILKCTLTSH